MRRARRLAGWLAAAGLALSPMAARAQERTPAQRQTIAQLAYVLGQSHALRQACRGPYDQYWRGRMQQLTAAEAPDAGFAHDLAQAFNTGFLAERAAFPRCDRGLRREQARTAARGRRLAASLGEVAR